MKIDRLVSIIMLLLERKRISAQELAARFEVSPRTIYRDIDTINLSGIPIVSSPGVGGGFEIMPGYKVDNKVFSSTELSTILMGLSNLSNLIREEELIHAIAKVKTFIPRDKQKDIEFQANQIYIDLSPWLGHRDIKPQLQLIKTALQGRKMLSFEYADRHGNKTIRSAEPCQLVLKGNEWYWQGYCHTRQDFRLFKISRTTKLNMLEKTFEPRPYQKPQFDFSEILQRLQTKVLLRIHESIKNRVLEFCDPDKLVADGPNHWLVNFPFIENDYYFSLLFSFGEKCECLEPRQIRTEYARRIHALSNQYGKG